MSETRKCRVCGKSFEVCPAIGNSTNTFEWRKIACSAECGAEYFRQISASRKSDAPVQSQPTEQFAEQITDFVVADDDEEDIFMEDIDDEELDEEDADQ